MARPAGVLCRDVLEDECCPGERFLWEEGRETVTSESLLDLDSMDTRAPPELLVLGEDGDVDALFRDCSCTLGMKGLKVLAGTS